MKKDFVNYGFLLNLIYVLKEGLTASAGQPPRQLEGFSRVSLAPGASSTVTFPLTQRNLQYWNTRSNA